MASVKKLVVVSDVHGRMTELRSLLRLEKDADALFFLGDGLRDLDDALSLCKPEEKTAYPIYRVRGNCDAGYADPAEGMAAIGGVAFFYTHGQNYGVKWDYARLTETASLIGGSGADVALFGHTHHRALVHDDTTDLPTLFNPGALAECSYGVITVENGRCAYEWKRVPKCE
jgi:putative phosphoesterase